MDSDFKLPIATATPLENELKEARSLIKKMEEAKQSECRGHPRAEKHTRYELAVALDKAISQRETLKNEYRKVSNDLEIIKAKTKGVEELASRELDKARVATAELSMAKSLATQSKSDLDFLRRDAASAFAKLAEILGAGENPSMEELEARALALKLKIEALESPALKVVGS